MDRTKGCKSPVVKVHGWRVGPVAGSYQQMCVFENFEESWKGHMKLQPWCRNIPTREMELERGIIVALYYCMFVLWHAARDNYDMYSNSNYM